MSLAATLSAATYDARLARSVLRAEPDAVDAALILFERNSPPTFSHAVGLLRSYGEISPQTFQYIDEAWDTYWHLRDMPGD